MPKRFIEPDWKELRKLKEVLQRAWFYIWDKADEAGVYKYDPDYMKLDLSLDEPLPLIDLKKLPECEILPGERILIKNFLVVNYKELKPDYNPHKPAFRAIEKNLLKLNSSLNQAYFKLEEEEEYEEEDKDESFGKSENLFSVKNKDGKDKWISKPTDQNLELLESEISNSIEFIHRIKKLLLTNQQVNDLWFAFKIQNFSGEKYYQSRSSCIQHFRNWLKEQKENKTSTNGINQQPIKRSKSDSAERLTKWLDEEIRLGDTPGVNG